MKEDRDLDAGGGVCVRIDALASDGRGVARGEGGPVWFVEDAFPGDLVEVREIRRRPRYVEAVRGRVHEAGPGRRESPCRYRRTCGGCPWMPLAEEAQRAWKRRIVVDALARIAGLAEPPVEPVLASPQALGYRNKVEFTLARDRSGEPVAGLHGARGAGVIDVPACAVQHPDADRAWSAVRGALATPGRDPAWWRPRDPVRIAVRRSSVDGAILVAIRANRPLPDERAFAAALAGPPGRIAGVVRIDARPGGRGGARERVLAGGGSIRERWLGTSFLLPAATFFQVNPGAADLLGATVVEACGAVGGSRVLDLYGGVGAYAWALSRAGAACTVVEADAAAIAAGRSADGGGAPPPRFERAEVAAWMASRGAAARPDLVVANPPRTGMGREVSAAIAASGASRVVVVSCDPATLARDVRVLVRGGYAVRRIVPVDLFPQTPHVETVTILDRSDEA